MKEVTSYLTFDGKHFSSKEECLKYEKEVKNQMLVKYQKINMVRVDEYEFLQGFGSGDCYLDIVDIKSFEQLNLIYDLIRCFHHDKYAKEYFESMYKTLFKVLNDETDRLIIYRGMYDDDCRFENFDVFMTLNEFLNELRIIGLQTTKNE